MSYRLTQCTLVFAAIILIGAGCSDTGSRPQDGAENTSTTQVLVKKQPPGASVAQNAYDHCIDTGKQLLFRYSSTAERSIGYCRFSDGKECPAIPYYQGNCTPKAGATTGNNGSQNPTNPRECSYIEQPICGADGNTYVNDCIAQLQEVEVLHAGTCKVVDSGPTPITDGSTQPAVDRVREQDRDAAQPQTDGNPSWFPATVNLLSNEANGAAMVIEECRVAGDVFYYQYENTPSGFSVLLDSNSNLTCFPDNDLSGSCPGNFSHSNRQCHVLWRS